ncbi:MAG: NAD(P)/FAD-dependent oxidoreductase [Syntrophales bacterium]|jgi:phytoene desaturase|nr:NAD(P)/FAD-dependent oxidoreductase [Syntrophales bacterium]MDD4338387.1 NAD(P)/FAD-dependent oxidoreductase [Syntrophales bacterium]HOG06815.1 NAD(P)/FAD-dependent oxidoreductase [Syntrophales bacterium]HPB70185.1 NAD(P)/FAD-dependent oxidoreductase [Syntrophales bacterium]HQN25976.1 NAD(P)/FAD-dependent oxidoreductase [Syntrophales bacterium]
MTDYDVIVIGAGCGGLSVGALLAKQGRKVLVLEQSDRIGGCCSTFQKEGYTFDLGASLIEDAEVIDWCFQRLGTTLDREVDLVSCDPVYDVIMKDGTRLKYPLSAEASARNIGALAPEDVKGWHAYADYMQGFLDAALKGFFLAPANTQGDLVNLFAKTPKLLKYGPMFASSYQGVMEKYFQDTRIRESIAFQSFYGGLPPDSCPGYIAMIPWSEHAGIYYSKGGMIGIPRALERLGQNFGLTVRLKTRVSRVIVRNRRALGVALADGTEITSDLVVSDINAKLLYLKMIGEEHLPWLARVGIKSYEYSMATPMLYLGVDYTPPLEGHHTLISRPMDELNDYWWNVYKKDRYAEEHFGIVSWTSHSDPGLAPQEGHHVLVLTLEPGPYRLHGTTWDDFKAALTEQILDYMSKRYIPGLAEHVRVAELSTPVDFERRLLSPEGAIYALRQDLTSGVTFRPAAKSKSIAGLYLVGASTHPGGGVPTTIASGMIAADLIQRYE